MREIVSRLSRRPVATLTVAILLLGFAAALWHYSLPRPGTSGAATRLYADGQLIGVIYPSRRMQSWVPLDQIPRSVVGAALAAEDRRFWSHPGIDLVAIGRALQANLRHREVREGASTITQQLARTLFLGHGRSWSRKVREAAIALLLELRYSKSRILEAYLNTVYLGQNGDVPVQGFPAAARYFFGKDLAALQVEEAAWLAGAIRAPNRLLAGPRLEAKRRRDEVLSAMQAEKLIEPSPGTRPRRAARRRTSWMWSRASSITESRVGPPASSTFRPRSASRSSRGPRPRCGTRSRVSRKAGPTWPAGCRRL